MSHAACLRDPCQQAAGRRADDGTVRRADTPVRAEVVHPLRLERDVPVELRQITQTVAWGAP